MNRTVFRHTFGLETSARTTCATATSPSSGGAGGCSLASSGASTHDTAGSSPAAMSSSKVPGNVGVAAFARSCGFVCSDPFDHTSLLRFIETRFGVEVPNLSEWRRSVTGDLTSALNLPPNAARPALPDPALVDPRVISGRCAVVAPLSLATDATSALKGLEEAVTTAYPVPPNRMPTQEPGRPRRPSGMGCSPPLLRIALRGVPARAGTHGFTARVVVEGVVPLRRVRVRINGRIVKQTRRARFGVRIPLRSLRAGANRITVSAADIDGRRVKRSAVVRRPRS